MRCDDDDEDNLVAAVYDGDRDYNNDGDDDDDDSFSFVGKVSYHVDSTRSISWVRGVGHVFKTFILKLPPRPRAYSSFPSRTNTRTSRRTNSSLKVLKVPIKLILL